MTEDQKVIEDSFSTSPGPEVMVSQVLNGALSHNLSSALVIGRDQEGKLVAFASSGDLIVNMLMVHEFCLNMYTGQYETIDTSEAPPEKETHEGEQE